MRQVKGFLRFMFKAVGAILVVLLLFIGSLFFREQQLPRCLVDVLERRASGGSALVRIDSASFGFRRGVRLRDVRVYDKGRPDSLENPVGEARLVLFDFFRRTLEVDGAIYRRLPDEYYEVVDVPPPPSKVEVDLPDSLDLSITLNRPDLLGISPSSITTRLLIDNGVVTLKGLRVTMPDRDRDLAIEGDVTLDFNKQTVRAAAKGLVKYSQIKPVVDILDQAVAIPYIEATTEVNDPIPANVAIFSDMYTGDFNMDLRFSPPRCRYRGVPVAHSDIGIVVNTENVGTNAFYRFTLDVPSAADAEGRTLFGRLTVDNRSGGRVRLGYDATSSLRFDDLLTIIDELPRSWFEGLVCETAPIVTVKGVSATDESDIAANDLAGAFELKHGSVKGLRVNDMKGEFSLRRDVLDMHARATGKTGGDYEWWMKCYMEGFDEEKSHFTAKCKYSGGSLAELADVLTFDLGERHGTVDADFELCGYSGTNMLATMSGKGKVDITNGRLAQMKLFAGLTELLSERIPGVSFLVNQSQASTDFTIKDGVFKSDNVYIEGGLISIKGAGTYDMAKDNLDFIVRAQLFKKESIVGKVIHPITSPFTKMLLEFKLTGPIDSPTWSYRSISDRLF